MKHDIPSAGHSGFCVDDRIGPIGARDHDACKAARNGSRAGHGRTAVAALAALLVLGACDAAGTGGPASPDAQRVYKHIMSNFAAYHALRPPKAMYACIAGPGAGGDGYVVHRAFAYGTGVNSDGEIFLGNLRAFSRGECEEWQEEKGAPCRCMPVDSNGKNVLPF